MLSSQALGARTMRRGIPRGYVGTYTPWVSPGATVRIPYLPLLLDITRSVKPRTGLAAGERRANRNGVP